jgi:DNA-binding Xre family transcriptional regulator
MIREVGFRWHLRARMAERGMFSTTDLLPHLAERGIDLHPTQVYRLVAGTPERLNLQILAGLCDILDCTPADLIETYAHGRTARTRKAAGGQASPAKPEDPGLRPTRARITPDS